MELVKSMELVEIIFNYKGALVEADIRPGKDCYGLYYIVELNGSYAYTLHCDEGKWIAVNEQDQSLPQLDAGFLKLLITQLNWELKRPSVTS